MTPAIVILGVLALAYLGNLLRHELGNRLHDTEPDELEDTIKHNLGVLAESVRESNRLDRLFRNPR